LIDFPTPVEALGKIRVPKGFDPRSPQSRRDLASTLRAKGFEPAPDERHRASSGDAGAEDPAITRLRQAIRTHPCHGCSDREDHARWGERHARLERETEALRRRIEGRTNTIARQFDRLREVLRELGYLTADDEVTPGGVVLGRIYSELDIVVAEALRAGVWADLDAAELAAAVSAVAYEARHSDDVGSPRLPPGPVPEVLTAMHRIWGDLDHLQREHGLEEGLRPPDPGFAWEAFLWTSGRPLAEVLIAGDRTPGDFVRWARQLVDLLGQVAAASQDTALSKVARRAADAVRRGVVADSSVG
jgi:ATP-dependent RNA helicase HelY